jgi:pimeloyl-ACP methyl ester carboxylesterase
MSILSLLRGLFTLLSLVLLGLAAYLLYEWYDGREALDRDGVVRMHRDWWMLWAGAGLLAWSFLGRWPMLWLLAGKDTDPTRAERGQGRTIQSTTGSTLYLEDHGSPHAQPIILTHGWSMDSTFWYYAKRDLLDRFRVIVWDLPGLGLSKRGGPKLSLSHMADDLKSIIAQTGDARPILVGHSIGGMVIETLARDNPQYVASHVAGVALLNTTYTNPLHTMILSRLLRALRKPVIVPMMYLQIWLSPLVWLSNWQSYLSGSQHLAMRFGFGRFVTRSQLEHVALLATRNSPSVIAHGDLAMLRWDSSRGPANLSMPTTVLGGSADIVTKPAASREIAGRIPGAKLRIIEGVNHMGPMERADLYNAEIADLAEACAGPLSAGTVLFSKTDPSSC